MESVVLWERICQKVNNPLTNDHTGYRSGFGSEACTPVHLNFFGTRGWFCRRQFFLQTKGWGRDSFRMIQAHYIYCILYFYYYYTVIYNEIIIQLNIMQNQWGPMLVFLQQDGSIWRWWETLQVCCLYSVYSVVSLWLLSLEKTLLHKDRMLEMEAGIRFS